MPVDFGALMLDPIYAALGVPAVLTLEDAREFPLTVIDKTSGVVAGERVDVPTALPAAAIRYAELISLGLNADDIVRGTLVFNNGTWEITNRKLNPNPSGEKSGEVIAMLAEADELASSES